MPMPPDVPLLIMSPRTKRRERVVAFADEPVGPAPEPAWRPTVAVGR